MKTISKSQHFLIKNEIYRFDILVSVNETTEKVKQTLKRLSIAEEDYDFIKDFNTQNASTYKLPKNQIVIRFKTVQDKHQFMSIIAHESLHAASFILDIIGMKFDTEISEEAYAYLTQFISYKIYQKVFK